MRLDAVTVGVGVLFSAVGICCVATFVPTVLGAGAVAGAVGFVSGLGLLVVPLAIVGVIGLIWLGWRGHRAGWWARITRVLPRLA